jgi:hypothetical protein
MNEQNNESQPTPNQTQPAQTNQNKPALAGVCLVCGGECAVGDTMCARCDGLMRGWLREYPSWLDSLHEFLDSTAHYGGRQPGRVNLPAAPTPIRLPVLDHMQAIEDAAIALWRRLYAPPAMPWATCGVHPPLVDMLRVCAGSPRRAACLTSPTSTMSGSRWFERRWTSSTCRLRNMASEDARTRYAESN